jgi:hypothetical protein
MKTMMKSSVGCFLAIDPAKYRSVAGASTRNTTADLDCESIAFAGHDEGRRNIIPLAGTRQNIKSPWRDSAIDRLFSR